MKDVEEKRVCTASRMSVAGPTICGLTMRVRYPGGDPENGPARFECREGHTICLYCGKGGIWYDGASGPVCDECAKKEEQKAPLKVRVRQLIDDVKERYYYFSQSDVEQNEKEEFVVGNRYTRPIRFVHEELLHGVGWKIIEHTWCRWFGHDIEDNSWAGPDSGGEDMSCRRCGWSFYHIYY